MVMASAGVNVPGGGDGNPAAAAAGAECRRRLSPPRASAAASGSSSSSRRRQSAPPTSSSDADTVDEGDTEEEAEEGRELPPVAPAAAAPEPAAAAEAWPVAFGSMELAGRMREMEDAISLHPGFFTWVDGTPMHLFAVFDGHGGPHVSALCRNQMHSILAEDLASEASRFLERRRQHHPWGAGERAEEEEAAWRAALRRAFARVDALSPLACACGAAAVPRCACPLSGATSAIVGSTAVVALVVGARVVVANCGDSRAVLCRGGHGAPPVPLSVDHKETGS